LGLNNFEQTILMASPAAPYITVEEYFLLEDSAAEKYEYVEGKVVAMAGASKDHNQIVSNLIREIGGYLKGKNCDVFPSDFRITTPSGESYFYPDASIVCGDAQMKPEVFDTLVNPLVIFEVISESTRANDKGYKFFYYQQIPSLAEYILIDSTQYVIDVIRRQTDGAWKFDSFTSPHQSFLIQSIGQTLSFNDVYYRVPLLQ
jgi:Uma2 family endonuclease